VPAIAGYHTRNRDGRQIPDSAMGTTQIEFEPFIGVAARQFIVNGLDMHNIAATGLPDCFPINFVVRGGRGDALGSMLGQL